MKDIRRKVEGCFLSEFWTKFSYTELSDLPYKIRETLFWDFNTLLENMLNYNVERGLDKHEISL